MAWPDSTPGWTDSGRLGNDFRAHSSSQGRDSSSAIFSRSGVKLAVLREEGRGAGEKAVAETLRLLIRNERWSFMLA
jgi:hypothetical protein